jgi:aminopeptidase N
VSCVLSLLLLAPGPAATSAGLFDAQHLKLEIALDEARPSISGRATETLRASRSGDTTLELDADEMRVSSVRAGDGRPLGFDAQPPVLRIELPRPTTAGEDTTVVVDYTAAPRRGIYFVGPSPERPRLPRQVWSQSWPNEARYWFPCPRDPADKVTSEVVLTTPAGYEAVSNGALVEAHVASGRKVWHWRLDRPIATYLISFVAGDYEVVRTEVRDPPVSLAYLVYRGRGADAVKTFARTPDILRYFSDLLGFRYPYSSYSQAVAADFPFEGMENPTAVTLADSILLDDRARLDTSSDDVIAHELAHQWWGDTVTPRSPRDLWLSESLATYFERLWLEHDAGADAASYQRLLDRDAMLAVAQAKRRPVIFDDPEDPSSVLDANVYQKGALVVGLLRREVGEEAFWNGLRGYLRRFAFGVAAAADFRQALEVAAGRGLEAFFDAWLSSPDVPELHVEDRWADGRLSLVLREGPAAEGSPRAIPLPVSVRITDALGARVETIVLVGAERDVTLPCPTRPQSVTVDPEARLPVRLVHARSVEALATSLTRGATAAERAQAARDLSLAGAGGVGAIADSLHREAFWGVRAEDAAALGHIATPNAFDALDVALRDGDPRVRAAAARAAVSLPPPRAAAALQAALAREESELVVAACFRSLGAVRAPSAFETLARGLRRTSHADRIRIAALDGLGALQDGRALPLALEHASEGQASAVRVAAVSALRALGRGQRVASARLTALLEDGDPRVRGAAAEALGELGDPRARGHLREALGMEPVPGVRRAMNEAIHRIEGGE